MPSAADSHNDPWWNAGDSEFSGATPLFQRDDGSAEADAAAEAAAAGEGYARRSNDSDPAAESDSGAGSPIMEALKLASALADWFQQTGLTDTLKALAAEAADSLATQSSTADESESPRPTEDQRSAVPTVGDDENAEHTAGTSCEFCPLCRGLDVMRTVQPQVAVGLAEAMASVTEALNTAVFAFTVNQRNKR